MKALKQLTLVIILLVSGNINAQVTTDWIARYDGTGNDADFINAMVLDGAGNIYVTGFSLGNGTSADFVTIKYNPAGSALWTKRYNGTGNDLDNARSIAVDDSGNVYVTGNSRGTTIGEDYATVKYNSAGTQKWVARHTGLNSADVSKCIALDDSGNVFVSGNTGLGSSSDILTIKYNSSGLPQWTAKYNGSTNGSDYVNFMTVDGSGNVYITGSSPAFLSGFDCTLIKYNSSGVIQWVKKYNGPANGEDVGNFLALDISGNIYVTGYSAGSGSGSDYVTVKYNSFGIQQWASRYNGTANSDDRSHSLAIDIIGNVYVTGESNGPQTFGDYASIKYNSSGVQQWVSRYDGPGNLPDIANSVTVDGLGNMYVTGLSNAAGNNPDIATIKYNSTGVQQWVERYNGPANSLDDAISIALDGQGNIHVAGQSSGTGTGNDYTIIKYSGQDHRNLNLTAFIEGFYNSSNNTVVSDTMKVYLRNTNSPYSKVDSAKATVDAFGNGIFTFVNADDGLNYYIGLKHRNSIETWSSSGNSFTVGTMTYNFSNSAGKAFGNNQVQIDNAPVRFAVYSGDVNQDGVVDASDAQLIDNDAFNFITGYINTDLTGENVVDASDAAIADNNVFNFVSKITP